MTISERIYEQAARSVIVRKKISRKLSLTPCLPSRGSSEDHRHLVFKCENLQHTGSFKFRGAMAKLTATSLEVPLITASSGNHGLAVANAARITGHSLTVVLPETVAEEKLSRIQALGVKTILHSNDSGLAEQHAREIADTEGITYVSPYNDAQVVAGQGTIGLELIEQVPDLDTVYVAMGGGGLISGIGSVLKAFAPNARVVGVSAVNSRAFASSLRAEKHVEVDHHPTLADGVAGGFDSDSITLPLASEVVDDLIDCSETEIADGVRQVAWTEKMLVEGSAGMTLAAWEKDKGRQGIGTSVVLLCGANFDRKTIAPILGGSA
ncbi:pyridoxal-phosphate dependent enzyme [Pseudaestuariivita rosea]|uniref:pyridoxal-phosphate dependent enzyme n=1 Tax=Pseudaestuariivita rosea TaxID=2763263 RepID=UPI001ABACF1C|nr:pyridoxal-phosphate dependent enzyme [Pseudaestuariivita rosea]